MTSSHKLRTGDHTTDIEVIDSVTGFIPPDSYRSLVICDKNTKRYAPSSYLPPVVLPPGEDEKTYETVGTILKAALDGGLGRDDTVVGIGGGVICDMAAFAASIYMRGCRLILIPTTLLAMVDASMGGKTGVDFGCVKNIVGSFYPADRVVMPIDVLASLSDREFKTGLAEAIKHSLLNDVDRFALFRTKSLEILERSAPLLREIIESSIRVKGYHVEADPKEHGIRAHLNLGHTFGHALEAATGYGLLTHGEAVAWGIGKAMKLGIELGLTDRGYACDVWELLNLYGFRLSEVEFDTDDVMSRMRSDKKKRNGRVRYIVQKRLGVTEIVHADDEIVRQVLEDDSAIE